MTDPTAVDTTAARRLDGNAAGGMLAELFAVDMTTARSRCAACGKTSMLGSHHVYRDAPALVVRCPECTEVVLRIASREGRFLLDLRGAQLLTVMMPVTADEDRRAETEDVSDRG